MTELSLVAYRNRNLIPTQTPTISPNDRPQSYTPTKRDPKKLWETPINFGDPINLLYITYLFYFRSVGPKVIYSCHNYIVAVCFINTSIICRIQRSNDVIIWSSHGNICLIKGFEEIQDVIHIQLLKLGAHDFRRHTASADIV